MSQIIERHGEHEPADGEPQGDPQRRISLDDIYAPIRSELAEVEAILKRELAGNTPWVDELLKHSRIVGGKRMRPVFLLLTGACCAADNGNGLDERHLQMAAALEMIHTATLIHDDVIDKAETRRHAPTANSRWGNKISVLLGDYLFTHAFHVASLTGSAEAMRLLAGSSNRVCAGEMRQNALAGNFDMSEEQYLNVVSDKTAELCAGGCGLGAMLSGANEETVESFGKFGRDIGIAFQIIDDVLDLVGAPDQVGKTLGTDIANRKPTLPVIHALATLDTAARARLLEMLTVESPSVKKILEVLNRSGSIAYARQIAHEHARSATTFAETLDRNEFSQALRATALFVLARSC